MDGMCEATTDLARASSAVKTLGESGSWPPSELSNRADHLLCVATTKSRSVNALLSGNRAERTCSRLPRLGLARVDELGTKASSAFRRAVVTSLGGLSKKQTTV